MTFMQDIAVQVYTVNEIFHVGKQVTPSYIYICTTKHVINKNRVPINGDRYYYKNRKWWGILQVFNKEVLRKLFRWSNDIMRGLSVLATRAKQVGECLFISFKKFRIKILRVLA